MLNISIDRMIDRLTDRLIDIDRMIDKLIDGLNILCKSSNNISIIINQFDITKHNM